MNPGDLVTPNPECGFLHGEVFLYPESSRRDHRALTPFRVGEIGVLLEVSYSYQEYRNGSEDIQEWLPVCRILAPGGTGWIQRNYLARVE